MRNVRPYILPLLGYLMLVIILFIPAMRLDRIISTGDISRSHYYYLTYLRDSIWQGRLPLWNPYTLLGQPFLANPSIAFWYPMTWLFLLLPIPIAFLVHMMFHVWWSMVGIFALSKRLTGKIFPAFVSGVVFGLCGYTVAHVFAGNYDVLAAGAWIGWVLTGVVIVIRRPKTTSVPYLAIPIGMQLLAGYASMSLYTFLAGGVLAFFGIVTSGKTWVRATIYLLIGLFAGVGIGMVQLAPNMEFTARTARTIGEWYNWNERGSLEATYFIQLVERFPFGGIMTPYQHPEVAYWEHAMYLGFVSVAIVCIGVVLYLWKWWKRPIREHAWWVGCVLIVAISIWSAMGRHAPFDLYRVFWQYVPGFRFIRIPGRLVYLIDAMGAVLVGFGVYTILTRVPKKFFVVGAIIILCAILADVYPYARQFIVTDVIPDTTIDQSVRTVLSRNLQPGERFSERDPYYFGYDAPVAYRLSSTNGYDVTTLRGPYLFVVAALKLAPLRYTEMDNYPIPANHPVMRFLSVRYALEEPSLFQEIPNHLDQHAVGSGKSPFGTYTIYRNDTISPLWRLVPVGISYASESALYEAIQFGRHAYDEAVGFVGSAPKLNGDVCVAVNDQAAKITKFTPEEVRLRVTSACAGYLTGSQVYYPGWTASIDGKSVPVYEANLGFMAIAMPKGDHEVVISYHSNYLVWGGLMTVLSLGLMGWYSFARR